MGKYNKIVSKDSEGPYNTFGTKNYSFIEAMVNKP